MSEQQYPLPPGLELLIEDLETSGLTHTEYPPPPPGLRLKNAGSDQHRMGCLGTSHGELRNFGACKLWVLQAENTPPHTHTRARTH